MGGLNRLDRQGLRGGPLPAALDLLLVGAAPALEAEDGFLGYLGRHIFRELGGTWEGSDSRHGRIFTTWRVLVVWGGHARQPSSPRPSSPASSQPPQALT